MRFCLYGELIIDFFQCITMDHIFKQVFLNNLSIWWFMSVYVILNRLGKTIKRELHSCIHVPLIVSV